ncbi:GlsB/YeaQ/YmgE family stress response membrane protein [Bacteroidota bacterium]
MGIIYFLLIGAIAGWLAGLIMKGKGFGLFVNMIVGCIGAVLGGYVFDILEINAYGFVGSLVTALIGALILLWFISLFKKKKK